MRKLRFAAVAMMLVVLAFPAIPAHAQAAPPAESDPAALLIRIKTLTEEIDLTPDQKQQIEAIFSKAADDLQSASQDMQSASPEEKISQFRNLLAGLRQQVGQLLTDDQKSELQQKLQTLRGSTTAPSGARNSSAATNSPAPNSPAPNSPAPNSPAQNSPPPASRRGGFGQNGPSTGAPGFGGPAPGHGGQFLQRLKSSVDSVGLSADQQSQVDDLFKDLQQQIQSLRSNMQNGSMKRQAFRDRVRSLFDNTRTRLGDILTPDQLQKLRQSMLQNAGGPAGGPGGNPNGGHGGPIFGNGTLQRNPAPSAPPIPAPAAAPEKPAVLTIQTPATPSPAVGQQAPDFSLKLLNGETAQLASYNHKLLVLVLGSYTNPSLRDRAAGLEALRDQFGTRGVNFLIIYTRETHPTGGWEIERNKTDNISITQPATEADRKTTAEHAKEAMQLSIPIAPDTMDNKTDTAYAVGDSTPAYLIGRDGKILFHQSWLEPMALGQAVQDALKQ